MTGLKLSALNQIKVFFSWIRLTARKYIINWDSWWINYSTSGSTRYHQDCVSITVLPLLYEQINRAENLVKLCFPFFLDILCVTKLFLMLLQLLTIISSIDDLNYPEKTNTYYIVNAPYIFSGCWKVRRYYSVWLSFLYDIFLLY